MLLIIIEQTEICIFIAVMKVETHKYGFVSQYYLCLFYSLIKALADRALNKCSSVQHVYLNI